MKQFERGREWWGLKDDGSWVKWNPETLAWEGQPGPPSEGLHESPSGTSSTRPPVDPPRPRGGLRIWPTRRELGASVGLFAADQLVLAIVGLVVVIVIVLAAFVFNPFF